MFNDICCICASFLSIVIWCASAAAQGPGVYGVPFQQVTGVPTANYIWVNWTITGSVPVTGTTCSIYVGSSGTSGDSIDCIVLTAPTPTTNGGSIICHATYTETSTPPNAWVTVNLPCNLAANTPYWIGIITNDPGVYIGQWYCGSPSPVCQNTTANTGNYGSQLVPQTYGTYTGVPTSFTLTATSQESVYILSKPTLNGTTKNNGGFF